LPTSLYPINVAGGRTAMSASLQPARRDRADMADMAVRAPGRHGLDTSAARLMFLLTSGLATCPMRWRGWSSIWS